jgi:hypothetical protein
MTTAAQDEFNDLVAKNTHRETLQPEDRRDPDNYHHDDPTEEDDFRNAHIESAMRSNTLTAPGAAPDIHLPPTSFDAGHSTGVKGVIADARSFEAARRSKWKSRIQTARQSIFGVDSVSRPQRTGSANSNSSLSSGSSEGGSAGTDEEAFLEEWRERRRKELESEAARGIRNRRTSPSARIYGRFDEVDAMGYLDAIEKVGRETKVLVFVYDHEVSPYTYRTQLCEQPLTFISTVRGLRNRRGSPRSPG